MSSAFGPEGSQRRLEVVYRKTSAGIWRRIYGDGFWSVCVRGLTLLDYSRAA